MKISAIIAEFNPFHNGHKYLIDEAKKSSDAVFCVMSGSFVQRGEAAIFDKWTRAEAAVRSGADLVLELPAVYAVSTAERFAFGAVSLIKKLGCADEIVFGSESGNIKALADCAKLAANEPFEISQKIKSFLADGMSFPMARQAAYDGLIDGSILNTPNNILAIEYMKSAFDQKLDIGFRTIRRIGDYHSEALSEYASATALRKRLKSGGDISPFIPEEAAKLFKNAAIYDTSALDNTVLYLLRSKKAEEIAEINDITEGLENALIKAAAKCSDVTSLIGEVSGKRYTKTKIARILVSLLLGTDKKIIRKEPTYARILAFNDTGRKIINKADKNFPIITKAADYSCDDEIFKKDILATDIATLCSNGKKTSGADFKTPPVYIKDQPIASVSARVE